MTDENIVNAKMNAKANAIENPKVNENIRKLKRDLLIT